MKTIIMFYVPSILRQEHRASRIILTGIFTSARSANMITEQLNRNRILHKSSIVVNQYTPVNAVSIGSCAVIIVDNGHIDLL